MRIDAVPTIPIDGLCLRPLEKTDGDAWYAYLSIPHVVRETSWNVAAVDDLLSLIAWYNSDDPSSAIRFAISPRTERAVIGTIGFHTISLANRTAEIAYDIHPDYWRSGIGSACCTAVTRWGLFERGYVRVQAVTLKTNLPSVRLLEKCGFALEGTLRSYRMVRGEPRDFFVFSKLPAGSSRP